MKKWLLYLIVFLPVSLYAQTGYREQLYLHTDRTVYVTGETIWYSAYLFDMGRQQVSSVSRQCYLELISEERKPVLQQVVRLDDGRGAGSLPIGNQLPAGRYQLRAYTNWMKNFDARFFFTQELVVLNPFVAAKNIGASPGPDASPITAAGTATNNFLLQLSAEKLHRRENFTIRFDSMPAAASIAVARIDDLPAPPAISIAAYFRAGGASEKHVISYLPEMEGPVLGGYLVDKTTGKRVAGKTGFLSAPGIDYTLAASVSDDSGRLFFNLPLGTNVKELVFHPLQSNNEQLVWEPQPLYADSYNFEPSQPVVYGSQAEALAKERNLNSQLMAAYHPLPNDSARPGPVMFGAPDKHYELDLYTRFPTMEEVIHEFIPEIRMRRSDGGIRFNVKNSIFNDFFLNEPLLLIDGVPVDHADDIIKLDPVKIKSVSVYTRKMFLGPVVKEGLIVLRTYKGDLNGYTVPKNDMVVQYSPSSAATGFSAPDYSGKSFQSLRIPDRRSLLYWNGLLERANKEITISTSDLPGIYLITIEGISRSGTFIHVQKKISVE